MFVRTTVYIPQTYEREPARGFLGIIVFNDEKSIGKASLIKALNRQKNDFSNAIGFTAFIKDQNVEKAYDALESHTKTDLQDYLQSRHSKLEFHLIACSSVIMKADHLSHAKHVVLANLNNFKVYDGIERRISSIDDLRPSLVGVLTTLKLQDQNREYLTRRKSPTHSHVGSFSIWEQDKSERSSVLEIFGSCFRGLCP